MAVKTAGGSLQMHSWTFANGVAVSVKGAKATIKGDLGGYGRVDAVIATGGKAGGKLPPGCKGSAGSTRAGTLSGTTKLVLDTGFFGTIAPKKIKALIAQAGKLTCDAAGTSPQGKGLLLTGSTTGADGQLMVSIVKQAGRVTQSVIRSDDATASAPASVMHMISAQTGAAGLDAAADMTTAKAAAAGPFLAGTLSFAGEPMGPMATGTLSGDFAAKFDSIGTQSLAAGTDGMLMQS
jgi:hypothetical protein